MVLVRFVCGVVMVTCGADMVNAQVMLCSFLSETTTYDLGIHTKLSKRSNYQTENLDNEECNITVCEPKLMLYFS